MEEFILKGPIIKSKLLSYCGIQQPRLPDHNFLGQGFSNFTEHQNPSEAGPPPSELLIQ
jgi:hypothetical protein